MSRQRGLMFPVDEYHFWHVDHIARCQIWDTMEGFDVGYEKLTMFARKAGIFRGRDEAPLVTRK